MRRMLSGLGVMLLAGGLTTVAGFTPAHADCPAGDGTVPGSASSVTAIGTKDSTQYTTIYIDDRDFQDLDEDNVAGGLWGYLESNTYRGLQRGGDQIVFTFVNPNVPRVEPISVLPPNPGGLPVFPTGLTLLPNGLGGGSLAEAAGEHDDCKTDQNGVVWTGKPDSILW